jgi:hypothetical protein
MLCDVESGGSSMIWKHVSESLPEIGVPVLLSDGKSILVGKRETSWHRATHGERPWRWEACGVTGDEWEWEYDDFGTRDPVTHWMPLPVVPS